MLVSKDLGTTDVSLLLHIYIYVYIYTYILYLYIMSDIKPSLTIHISKVGAAFKHVAGKETTLVFCPCT